MPSYKTLVSVLLILSAGKVCNASFKNSSFASSRSLPQTLSFNKFFEDTSKTKKSDTASSASPRDGKYLILSYGSNPANPLRLGFFTLTAGEYKYYDLADKLLGDGTYVYDVSDKQIKWQSGPFKSIGWNGDFTVERNGKTHIIRLKSNTVGTNSVE